MLINNLDDIKRVMQVSAATSYNKLSSHIQNAEKDYIVPIIGQEMYDALVAYSMGADNPKYTDPSRTQLQPPIVDDPVEEETPGEEDPPVGEDPPAEEGVLDEAEKKKAYANALWYAQHASIHLAYYVGFSVLSAYINDGGFMRHDGDNFKSLFKYQEDRLRRYFLESGMNSLDNLLEALEKGIEHFEEFQSVYETLRSNIFPGTRYFQEVYNINNSRIVFMRLKQHIKTVEDLTIIPAINAGNFAIIQVELVKDEPDIKVRKILNYLRKAAAYLSSAMLMEESGADITERGLYFTGLQGSGEKSDTILPTLESRIDKLIVRNRETGNTYLNALLNLMAKDGWTGNFKPTRNIHNRNNTGKRTFFA